MLSLKLIFKALAGITHLVEGRPVHRKVVSSIPSQGTYWRQLSQLPAPPFSFALSKHAFQ